MEVEKYQLREEVYGLHVLKVSHFWLECFSNHTVSKSHDMGQDSGLWTILKSQRYRMKFKPEFEPETVEFLSRCRLNPEITDEANCTEK